MSPSSHPSLTRLDHRPWPLPSGPWVMRQSWCDLLFAHWPVPAETVRPFVPARLQLDEHEGTTWVGLVPFRMEGVTARGLPAVPGLSAFPEMNLRLYVRVDDKPGVWFVSLDADKAPAVWAARRFFHLPYFRAAMTVRGEGQRVHYRSVRRAGRGGAASGRVAFRGEFGPTGEIFESAAGSLEHFLTERYCLYSCDRAGTLFRAEIHHGPWPLQLASARLLENTVGSAQGLPTPGPPPLLHFSRRQDVIAWPLRRV